MTLYILIALLVCILILITISLLTYLTVRRTTSAPTPVPVTDDALVSMAASQDKIIVVLSSMTELVQKVRDHLDAK